MGFLQRLLSYKKICIQCHNSPDADAIASAFGVYRYLNANGVDATIIYGGEFPIRKMGLRMLVDECGIPVKHVSSLPECEMLVLVDCQYGQGNVQRFEAPRIAVIDHHIQGMADAENVLIRSDYQSCATLIWKLLCEEGYPVDTDGALSVALLYGLYTDTSCFTDLFTNVDTQMRMALFDEQPLFEHLTKASMTVDELLIVSDAMLNHRLDPDRHFAIVRASTCDQPVLGIIGDFMIQVDSVFLSFAYTDLSNGYQISLRTCREDLPADRIAAYLCSGIGNGGGHRKKAGGFILKEKLEQRYGKQELSEVAAMLLNRYMEEHSIVFS